MEIFALVKKLVSKLVKKLVINLVINLVNIMITVIKNAQVITMDESRQQQIEQLDIVIENENIANIIPTYNGQADYIIDATDKVVMPGLINTHTHSTMSIFRASNDNLTLMDWLTKKIFPVENKLTDDDTFYTCLHSCLEYIKTGTTTFCDMTKNIESCISAAEKMQLRCLIGGAVFDNKNDINNAISIHKKYQNNTLINFTIAPHSLYLCPENILYEVGEAAKDLNLPIHIHFCESNEEVQTIIERFKASPANVLKKLNYLNNDLILAHFVHTTKEDLEILNNSKNKVSIAHCPISNLNLGSGIADIINYQNNYKNINITVATDGVGSGNNLNLFYHLSLVDLLQKGKYQNSTVLNSYNTLKMVTTNAAKAVNLENQIGCIKVGNKADLIILNLSQDLATFPSTELINNIVHNAFYNCVETTIVNGKILMENKQIKADLIDEVKLKNSMKNIIKKVEK